MNCWSSTLLALGLAASVAACGPTGTRSTRHAGDATTAGTGGAVDVSGPSDTLAGSEDGSGPTADAATAQDAGAPVTDAGTPIVDAGGPVFDAGDPAVDAWPPDADAEDPVFDAEEPVFDAGTPLEGSAAQIQAALDAPDGPVNLSVSGVVTRLKPALGGDLPGFFVQADTPGGPALFVAVDSAGVDPGELVSFEITGMGTDDLLREALAIQNVQTLDTGLNVGLLVQDISSVSSVAELLNSYVSEVINATVTIDGDFGFAGPGFSSAPVSMPGLVGDGNLRLRIPDAALAAKAFLPGCVVSVSAAPLWRHQQQAQISGYMAADFNIIQCPDIGSLAAVRINELQANNPDGCDTVELRVIAGGNLNGYTLKERQGTLGGLNGLDTQSGDLIVMHLNANSPTCNPSGATSELDAKSGQPASLYPQNTDAAWDLWVTDAGLTASDNVITLYAPGGVIHDAVFVTDAPDGTAAKGSESQAALVAAAGQWTTPNGSVPGGGFVDDTFNANAVVGLSADPTQSIQRGDDQDSNSKLDWTVGAASIGNKNAGQVSP